MKYVCLRCAAFMTVLSLVLIFSACPPKHTAAPPPPPPSATVQTPSSGISGAVLVQPRLDSPGGSPFHLKAVISEKDNPNSETKVEMFWVATDKWRRVIDGPEFSQTLIVNGQEVFEQDSDDYFPLYLQTLVTALVNPQPILEGLRPGDRLSTKANGAAQESGLVCFDANHTLCAKSRYGLQETVGAPGHPVTFTDYQEFNGQRVAHLVMTSPERGVNYTAKVTELSNLKDPDNKLFSIPEPTPVERRIRTAILSETEFRNLALQPFDIIWPQVLDGAITGTSSYYVSLDRSGQVRETAPLETANERANDSARRQLMKWKFRPVVKDGAPVQAEGTLTFATNTRAWGPPEPLSNDEVRKLATNIVEPNFPSGAAPSGAAYSLRAAIDDEGNVIEVIAGEGPPGLFMPCYDAIKKWHFSPFIENGQPRPYRATIKFTVP